MKRLRDRREDNFESTSDAIEHYAKVRVRNKSEQDCPGQTGQGTQKTHSPLPAIDPGDTERCTADEDDHDLATDHDAVDSNEPEIAMHAFENIEFVVESATVELVEDLHPDEGVENHGIKLPLRNARLEDLASGKV